MMEHHQANRGGSGIDPATSSDSSSRSGGRGWANARTALVLLSIALVFFIGVIANRLLFN